MNDEDGDYSSDAEAFYAAVADAKYCHLYWRYYGITTGLPFGKMYVAPLSH